MAEPPVRGQRFVHDAVEVRVVRELHVSADVPRESPLVHVARRQPADPVAGVDEQEVGLSESRQPVRGSEARRAGAQDEEANVFGQG
jgi:hypothetical protein